MKEEEWIKRSVGADRGPTSAGTRRSEAQGP